MKRKGIILAGGCGTRLYPSTSAVSKHLMPIYDKPMIYYSLSTLMLADIRDILIICRRTDLESFKLLFSHLDQIGVDFSFLVQEQPLGIANGILLAKDFLEGQSCAVILGDNFFYGHDFAKLVNSISKAKNNTIVAYPVKNPQDFGVVEFDSDFQIKSLDEKPVKPMSRYAITGLYFFDETVCARAKRVKISSRNEFEIVDVLRSYLNDKQLSLEIMGRGEAWLDAGAHESLMDASLFVRSVEKRQGLKIGCPEEIAWRKGWITTDELLSATLNYKKSSYLDYLISLPNENILGRLNE